MSGGPIIFPGPYNNPYIENNDQNDSDEDDVDYDDDDEIQEGGKVILITPPPFYNHYKPIATTKRPHPSRVTTIKPSKTLHGSAATQDKGHSSHHHEKGPIIEGLGKTATIFIGVSAVIVIIVLLVGLYFWCKSKKSKSNSHVGSEDAIRHPSVVTKGRGVTRPSFLPSGHHHVQQHQKVQHSVRTPGPKPLPTQQQTHVASATSIHLDIPSPDSPSTNYPITTPYSFPSTSTELEQQQSSKELDKYENNKGRPHHHQVILIMESPVEREGKVKHPATPIKPRRNKQWPEALNFTDGDGELLTQRVTVY